MHDKAHGVLPPAISVAFGYCGTPLLRTPAIVNWFDKRIPEGTAGAVTLIQRISSAANLNVHLGCLVLDGVYPCGGDGRCSASHRSPQRR